MNVPEALALQDQRAEEARKQRALDLAAFGDGLEFTPETLRAVELQLASYVRLSTAMAVEAGRRLLWVRENMGDAARFEQWVHERTGFSRRTAYSHMALARRMMDHRLAHFADLDLGRVRALCDLSDEDLDRLAEEGRLGDLTADEVERLSVRELRERVRMLNQRIREGAETEVRMEHEITTLRAALGQAERQLNERACARLEATRIALGHLMDLFREVDPGRDIIEQVSEIVGDGEAALEMLSAIEPMCRTIVAYYQEFAMRDIHSRSTVRHPRGLVAEAGS